MSTTFERAKSLHAAGDWAGAADLYRDAADADPEDFRARHNLGVVHEALGDHDAAARCYREAIAAHPGAAWSHYNLARLEHLAGRLDAAEDGYRAALALEPELAEAHFNLGRLMLERGDAEAAERALRERLRLDPADAATHGYLGDALFEQRRPREALDAYRESVAHAPTDAAAQFDVAKALECLRRHDEAIDCYRRSLVLDPASAATREALARALDAAGRRDEAVASLREWLSIAPDHPIATHLLAALGAAPAPARAADAYVREAFDRFAADFDATLARLDYQAPDRLAQALAAEVSPPRGDLDVLDLGCGTGLLGPRLLPWARRLEGVDLSPRMLARARQRGVYHALHEAELTAFLGEFVASWDVIACADTLCYFGELSPVLRAAARALRDDGLLLFTLERLPESTPAKPVTAADPQARAPAWALQAHGRYAHREGPVIEALEAAGFGATTTGADLRMEGGRPVEGIVAVGRRAG